MKLRLKSPEPQLRALLLATLALTPASTVYAQAAGQHNAQDVHVRIETDAPTYRRGDTIAVRLTLRNTSAHPVEFVTDAPSGYVRLLVFDAKGQPVEPASFGGRQLAPISTRPIRLKAGQELTLKYQGREWLDLKDWGYHLPASGRYTVVGIPMVGGHELKPDYAAVRSNAAAFLVER
jgi:hypothetical protein